MQITDPSLNVSSLIFTQLTSGAACAYLLQLLQKWRKLPWITEHTDGINRFVRVAMSFGTALGISWVWAPAVTDGGHMLEIAIPSGIVLVHGLWHVFGQYALQHGWSKLFQIPITSPPIPVDKELK